MAAFTPETGFAKSIHGRHLMVGGDAESVAAGTNGYTLWLGESGGGVAASTRDPIFVIAAGSNGAGAITVAGTKVGDKVLKVILSTFSDSSASFESTVTVAGQVQQSSTSNLSGNTYLFIVRPLS